MISIVLPSSKVIFVPYSPFVPLQGVSALCPVLNPFLEAPLPGRPIQGLQDHHLSGVRAGRTDVRAGQQGRRFEDHLVDVTVGTDEGAAAVVGPPVAVKPGEVDRPPRRGGRSGVEVGVRRRLRRQRRIYAPERIPKLPDPSPLHRRSLFHDLKGLTVHDRKGHASGRLPGLLELEGKDVCSAFPGLQKRVRSVLLLAPEVLDGQGDLRAGKDLHSNVLPLHGLLAPLHEEGPRRILCPPLPPEVLEAVAPRIGGGGGLPPSLIASASAAAPPQGQQRRDQQHDQNARPFKTTHTPTPPF